MALPAVLGLFGAGIGLFTGYAVTRVLLALGMSYILYQGLDVLLESAEDAILNAFGQLPADVYNILLMAGADVGFTILFSAFATRLLLSGWQAGSKAVLGIKP